MKNNNSRKNRLLGMSHGSAVHKLRQSLLFHMANRLGMLQCHQCGARIESVSEMSIEHKDPWQSAVNPYKKFFDLDNIAFSHLKCNIGARNSPLEIKAPAGKH